MITISNLMQDNPYHYISIIGESRQQVNAEFNSNKFKNIDFKSIDIMSVPSCVSCIEFKL